MGIGIYNKLKKAFKAVGQRIGGFAKKAVVALPKIADVGHKVIGAVSPILSTAFPGTGPILNTIDKGLNYVGKFASNNSLRGKSGIGRSLIPELDWLKQNKLNGIVYFWFVINEFESN